MEIRKIGKTVLRILQGIVVAFLVVAGIGSMPSVFGMMLLMMAVFVTPPKMRQWFLDDWIVRIIWGVDWIVYFSYLPQADVRTAGRNFGVFLIRIWEGMQSLF